MYKRPDSVVLGDGGNDVKSQKKDILGQDWGLIQN